MYSNVTNIQISPVPTYRRYKLLGCSFGKIYFHDVVRVHMCSIGLALACILSMVSYNTIRSNFQRNFYFRLSNKFTVPSKQLKFFLIFTPLPLHILMYMALPLRRLSMVIRRKYQASLYHTSRMYHIVLF